MTGQARVGAVAPAIGPMLQGQTRESAPSKSSSRDMAAKAVKTKLNPASSVKAAEASGLLGTQSSERGADSLSGGNTGFKGAVKRGLGSASSLLGDMGQLWGRGASVQAAPGVGNTPDELAQNRRSLMGIPSANASDGDISRLGMALQKGSTPDMPTGYGDNGEIFFNGNDEMSLQGRMRASGEQTQQNNPLFGIPTAQADDRGGDSFKQKQDNWKNPWGDVDISGESAPEKTFEQVQNETFSGGPGPVDNGGGTTGNRSGRGSGLFGTGKGVGNPAGGQDDPYIKELRKAYSSNGGEKWLRKQFEELIAALDPTYAQLQTEGTNALNAQLNNQNVQLASVMNANNTGDSEQRAQLMAGQQRDSQTALGNLLAKLSQNKAQDVSGYKGQMAEAMSKYKQNEQQGARTLLEKIQAYRGQQAQGAGSGAARVAPQMTGKTSRNEVFNWVEDALGKGYSWEEISQNAKEQGIGTETDGYLDQLLRNANKQNRFAR